jgi:hypothetical protein
MTLTQIELLLFALTAFSLHDYLYRTIPPWLCAVVAGFIGLTWLSGLATWWWISAVLGATVFWGAGLPMGDRAGIFLVAGLLPHDQAAQLVLASALVGLGYLELAGRRRSMIGVPFFPAVAICAMVVVAGHHWFR